MDGRGVLLVVVSLSREREFRELYINMYVERVRSDDKDK